MRRKTMHRRRVFTRFVSVVTMVVSVLAVSAGGSVARTPSRAALPAGFSGTITCVFSGQAAYFPPLTATGTEPSHMESTGQLSACIGDVTQQDWTITGAFVTSYASTIEGSCSKLGGDAFRTEVFWQATASSGATPSSYPPPTRISGPAPLVGQADGSYTETWTDNLTTTGSFRTSDGALALGLSPSVADLTTECTTPASAPSGLSYVSTSGTVSL